MVGRFDQAATKERSSPFGIVFLGMRLKTWADLDQLRRIAKNKNDWRTLHRIKGGGVSGRTSQLLAVAIAKDTFNNN